jgi:hypothetical protein
VGTSYVTHDRLLPVRRFYIATASSAAPIQLLIPVLRKCNAPIEEVADHRDLSVVGTLSVYPAGELKQASDVPCEQARDSWGNPATAAPARWS